MTRMELRVRMAALLVLLALVIEAGSFFWKSPLAFVLFLVAGCGLAAVGIFVFLIGLVSADRQRT